MNKKLLTVLALLLGVCSGAWATTETVSWTDMATSSHNANKAGTATSANLTPAKGVVNSLSTNGSVTKDFGSGSTTYYRYSGFEVSEDVSKYFEYSFSVASGYAFTPSKITVGWAPNGGKAVCFYIYAGTSASNLVKIGQLIHSSDNTYAADEHTTFTALGENTNFTMIRLVPCGKASSIVLNSVAIEGSLVTDTRTDVNLSFISTSGSADIADGATLPALSSDPNVTAITDNISYFSSNTGVATVNVSTGALTLVGMGTTTITASFAGNATYKPASVNYTLTVTDRTKLGLVEIMNTTAKTLDARLFFGMEHAAVTKVVGSNGSDYAGTSKTVYYNKTAYTNVDSWYKKVDQAGYDDNQYIGYDITVEDGYTLSLSNIDARVLLSDNVSLKWKVVITDNNGTQLYTSSDKTTKIDDATTPSVSDALSLSNLTGIVHVLMYVASTGTWKAFSIEKLILTGTTAADARPERTVTFAAGSGMGTVPADVTVREGDTFIFPATPLLYKIGSTLTAWNDGTNDHNVGTSVTVSADMNLTAQYTTNTVALGDAATTVEWTFKTQNGAPSIGIEGGSSTPVVYSSRTTIGSTPFDALMTIDATSGKFNTTYNATYAQVAAGTKFTIPAAKGMVVTLSCNQPTTAVDNASFDGEDATSFDGTAKTLTYTYNGSMSEIDIVVNNGNLYPDGISVTYPTNPVGNHTISYALNVTSTENKSANTITSTDTSSSTFLKSLIGIANNTGGDLGTGDKANLTVKIPTPETYDADNYMSVGFTVQDGYIFTPSSISVKAQPVTTDKTVKLVLTDGVNSIEKEQAFTAGTITTITETNDGGVALSGNVTLKIYCYGATDTYRLGSPITIAGVVSEAGPTEVTATINPTYGYATFSSTYALDFTGITTLNAYIATGGNGSSVTLQKVEGSVAANTGLIIEGETTDIPVAASGTDYSSSNKLWIWDESWGSEVGAADNENYTNYVLSWQNSQVVFAPVIGTPAPINGGQCVLTLPKTNSARVLTLSFDNSTTGVSTSLMNNDESVKNGEVYNLNGQLVATPSNGIYIVNGKKVIIK